MQEEVRHAEGADYPIKVINLACDVDRWERIAADFAAQGLRLERCEGVAGSSLSESVRFLVAGGREGLGSGSQGCVLAHIGVLQTIAAGDAPHVLVLEDDAVPVASIPARFEDLGIPGDYDLCYVNERMEPRSMKGGGSARQFVPLSQAMLARDHDQRGHGTDGYFVSRAGAAKVLDFFYRDRILANIDTQLLGYGQTRDELLRLTQLTGRYKNQQLVGERRHHDIVLRSYVMTPPLVRQGKGGSTRKREDARAG